MTMVRKAVLVFSVMCCTVVGAADYERRLVPIAASATRGSFGSVWTTRVAAVAETHDDVEIVGFEITRFPPVFSASFPWDEVLPNTTNEPPGTILYVPTEVAESVHITALLEERSAVASPYASGERVALPIVHESDFRSTTNYFLSMSKQGAKRLLLRVYSLDLERPSAMVRVRIQANFVPYDRPWGLIYDQQHALSVKQRIMSNMEGTVTVPVRPLALEVPIDALLTGLPEDAELAISVVPLDGLRIWSMISETDNSTQRVVLRLRD